MFTHIQKKYVISNAFCKNEMHNQVADNKLKILIMVSTNGSNKGDNSIPETGQNGSNKELTEAS